MATCNECDFYKSIDSTMGTCFEHEVPGDMPAEKCPAKAFKPRKKKT